MIFGILLCLAFAFLVAYSFLKIRRGQGIAEFIYQWGFLIGAFVWEDLLVFSLYGLITTLVTLIVGQVKVGLLFFLVFWIVRSFGEAFYFFLQQFIVPKHFPHYVNDHFWLIRRLFGNISYQQCLIILQVMFQIILMLSLSGLIFLLQSWDQI